MTFEEFLAEQPVGYDPQYRARVEGYHPPKKKIGGKPAIVIRWETGGVRGGNCWGGEHETYYSDEKEPDFEDLEKILEWRCPNLTFLQYKRICKKVIKQDQYTVNDYYGNHTDYSENYVYLEDLYNTLKEMELIK